MAKQNKIYRTIMVPPDVWARLKLLVDGTGLSINQCVERIFRDVISAGRIPGIMSIEEQEQREHEKWGTATPTYEGQKTPQKGGKRMNQAPAESS